MRDLLRSVRTLAAASCVVAVLQLLPGSGAAVAARPVIEAGVTGAEGCRLMVADFVEVSREPEPFPPSCWYVDCAPAARRELGCGLSALSAVAELAISPDGCWLAVVSVGEGHPVLEIVEVAPLLAEPSEYRTNLALNPYPGGFGRIEWLDGSLEVSSDMPLGLLPRDGAVSPVSLLPAEETKLFRIDPTAAAPAVVPLGKPAAP